MVETISIDPRDTGNQEPADTPDPYSFDEILEASVRETDAELDEPQFFSN
jgi:hypothetical protein